MKINWKFILSLFRVFDKFSNNEPSIYFGLRDFAIENKQWDHPPFDPELLTSLDKDIENLSQEEQHLLRQIQGDSNLRCANLYAKGNEYSRQDSSGTEDTHMYSTFPYKK